jgi:glycosyltransferase involved in cell wall biosynthesis
MRVLHLSTWNDQCGIADYARQLVAALQCQPDAINELYPQRRHHPALMSDDALRELFEGVLVLASAADLVHIQHELAFFAGRRGYAHAVRQFGWLLTQLRQRDVPIVTTFHNEPKTAPPAGSTARTRMTHAYHRSLWRWHVARHFRRGERRRQAIVHTQRSRQLLIESGFNPAQVQVVPPGHPRRSAPPPHDRAMAKARLGFPQQATVLSIFGSLANRDSYAWVVETLKTLPSTFVLAVVGGSQPTLHDEDTVNAILESWKHRDPARLRITGFVSPEMVDAYHAATDICLVPHLPCSVSASVAMPWALTSGRPTIATDIAAFRYLNEDAACLLLVRPGDVGELAARIQDLARDAAKQEELVRRALAYASANGWEALASRHLDIYQSLVHQPPGCVECDPHSRLDLPHAPRVADLFQGR